MNRFRIDPGMGHFTVQAFAGGLLSAFAHNPTFAVGRYGGEIRLGGTAESLEIDLTVDPASFVLSDRVSAIERREIERRMWTEILEISVYREFTIQGKALSAQQIDQGRYRTSLAAELTVHGTSSQLQFEAELIIFADGLRLVGHTTMRMSEHGIKPVSAVAGAIKVKDELQITFELAALPIQS